MYVSKVFLSCLLSEITGKLCYKTILHLKCSISYAHDLMTRTGFLLPLSKKSPLWKIRLISKMSFLIAARSELEPKYRFERCQEVKGICKPFCDDIEYDYGYCIKWRNQCCI